MKATEFHFGKTEGIINTVGESGNFTDLYSALYYMIPAFFLVLCFDFLIFKVCGRKKVSKCFSAVYEVYKEEE